MAKFLRILRLIALSAALMGVLGMAIFGMNDIGTAEPMKICAWVTAAALAVAGILLLAERKLDKGRSR